MNAKELAHVGHTVGMEIYRILDNGDSIDEAISGVKDQVQLLWDAGNETTTTVEVVEQPGTYEEKCQRVWLEAWTATASASNCNNKASPTIWADTCLADFRQRFKEGATQ